MSLEKLEKKVEKRAVKVDETFATLEEIKDIDTDKVLEEIQKNYRLISNTNNRQERKLNSIEQKLDFIVKAIENSGVDSKEIERQEEIKRLENKLKELRGE